MTEASDSPLNSAPNRSLGRSRQRHALVTPWQADVLNATLNRDDPQLTDGDPLPPGWHWLYFPEAVKLADTGPDGHALRGQFLPDTGLPYRMWAGNRMRFHDRLRIGDRISCTETVSRIEQKSGASGPLCFVTVTHEIATDRGLAVVEELDLVYRGPLRSPSTRTRRAEHTPQWSRTIVPDPMLLFRFSALTMNTHRIHYDYRYATEREGYPGLVVHGPLLMVLLLDLLRRELPRTPPRSFSVRALGPLFDDSPFTLQGLRLGDGEVGLWAAGDDGGLAMQGNAVLASNDGV